MFALQQILILLINIIIFCNSLVLDNTSSKIFLFEDMTNL